MWKCENWEDKGSIINAQLSILNSPIGFGYADRRGTSLLVPNAQYSIINVQYRFGNQFYVLLGFEHSGPLRLIIIEN